MKRLARQIGNDLAQASLLLASDGLGNDQDIVVDYKSRSQFDLASRIEHHAVLSGLAFDLNVEEASLNGRQRICQIARPERGLVPADTVSKPCRA